MVIINNAAMKIGVCVHFLIMVFSVMVSSGGIVESYGKSIFTFLRKLHAVLNSGYTSLHSH